MNNKEKRYGARSIDNYRSEKLKADYVFSPCRSNGVCDASGKHKIEPHVSGSWRAQYPPPDGA
jgi:hypothetical protein